jgi:GNAT superfamily N-acetyltransferase
MGNAGPVESVVVGADDVDAAAEIVTGAFLTDPLWSWAFPLDVADREDRMRRLWRLFLRGAVPHGWVFTDASRRTTSVWIPPGRPELPADETDPFDVVLERTVGDCAERVAMLMDEFDAQHPHEPASYYLSLWATHASARGTGLGTGLIRHDLARLDALGMPAYLESSNAANDGLYAHLGFELHGRISVPGGPPVTTMWRDPR